jgi:hypothetical protein
VAGKSSIWVQIRVAPESGEVDRVRADRVLEVNTRVPGEVELRISGWKDPAVVPLAPGSMEETAGWAAFRAYWSVLTLPGMRQVNRPTLDRTLLTAPAPQEGAGAGDVAQRLEQLRSARQQEQGLPPVA